MVLNLAKTNVMLITTCQKRQRFASYNLYFKYSDESLKMISNDKILGGFVDNNLIWSDHVKHICKKNIFIYLVALKKWNTFSRKNTVYNFINLIYNLTLIFAILSAVCDCGISWSYSLTTFVWAGQII